MIRVLFILLSLLWTFPALGQDDAVSPSDATEEVSADPAIVTSEVTSETSVAPSEEVDADNVAAPEATATGEGGVPTDLDGAAETVSLLVQAINNKAWPVVVGLALVLVVFVLRKFGAASQLPAKWTPWLTLLLAVAATVGTALGAGVDLIDALYQGLVTGVMAMGAWDLTKVWRKPKNPIESISGVSGE